MLRSKVNDFPVRRIMFVSLIMVFELNYPDLKMNTVKWMTLFCIFEIFHCYVNIAFEKPAYQQYPYLIGNATFDASNAVDGRKSDLKWDRGQCAVSAEKKETATWWVNLTRIHSIHHITLYFMTNNTAWGALNYFTPYYLGFSVYVANTTERFKGKLCYKDNNFTRNNIPVTFTTTCPVRGQYIMYYNERLHNATYPGDYSLYAVNNLCEVEVYGCQAEGYYGPNCSIPCPDVNCQYCHIEKGTCQGCKPGYQDRGCKSVCPHGFFGHDCANKCKDTCNGCNHVNGMCDYGCLRGWNGGMCQKTCKAGLYGFNCNETCGYCLDSNECVRFDGLCLTGCEVGYNGSTCKSVCPHGFFGDDCANKCKDTCNGCNHVNGMCDYGCLRGWNGEMCQEPCQAGSYGFNCNETCGYCLDSNECVRFDGLCLTGCEVGYNGSTCKSVCPHGFFGDNCANKCKDTCNGCNHVNGMCDYGCLRGWNGEMCQEPCQAGSYGFNCNETCGYCLDSNECVRFDGLCLTGCEVGYNGSTCKSVCSLGFYGKNCAEKCIDTCNGCNKVNGLCDSGCKPGWKGDNCHETCEPGFYGINCKETCGNCREFEQCVPTNGTCLIGCDAGYQGEYCKTPCEDSFYGINCTQKCDKSCFNRKCHHETGECISRPMNLSYIGGSIAAIAITFVLGIIMYRALNDKYRQDNMRSMENETTFTSNVYRLSRTLPMRLQEGYSCENLHIHEENQIPDIAVNNIGNVIQEYSDNDDEGFKKEYEALFHGENYLCEIAKLPTNIPKNRFKTIVPYDHSRVMLVGEDSDYINANYIDEIGKEQVFIATQGPLQNTIRDFWLMIWQENVSQIVMLTNIMEGNKMKCVQYWPDLEADNDYDVFTISTSSERQYAFYIIRKMKISHKMKYESRIITQYHYTSWPDHDVPDPLCLLSFNNHIRGSTCVSHSGPILVHCSAGIGRTGTYIAIDALFKEGQKNSKINIAEYVKKMRENRMNMVQTYEQYKTIYLTLQLMFKSPVTVQSATEFLQNHFTVHTENQTSGSSLLNEFEKLLSVCPWYTEWDYRIATQYGELSSIRPLDKYIIYLTTTVPNRGNYINAITMPSYTNRDGYIITNYPAPDNAVDFQRLIIESESEVVICMEPLTNAEYEDLWIPTSVNSQTTTHLLFQLQQEHKTEVKCRKIEITNETIDNKTHSIMWAEPLFNLIPVNSKTVSQILGLVSCVKTVESKRRITIISRDGAALCGVFCAVYNLIQQLTMDEEIDVFSVVRLLQTRRPELCDSLDEYKLIHEVLFRLIKSRKDEHIYCNQHI